LGINYLKVGVGFTAKTRGQKKLKKSFNISFADIKIALTFALQI